MPYFLSLFSVLPLGIICTCPQTYIPLFGHVHRISDVSMGLGSSCSSFQGRWEGTGGDGDTALTWSRVLCSCSCVTAQRGRAPCTSQDPSSLGNVNLCPEARHRNKWHWNLVSKFTAVQLNADFHNPVGVCWVQPHTATSMGGFLGGSETPKKAAQFDLGKSWREKVASAFRN